ncbi:MAG: ABC transporter permease [Rhodothermales bacterium]
MIYVLQALWKREIIKFVRDRSRLIGALAQPVVFWLLLGLGFQRSFTFPAAASAASDASINYLEYLFPGTIALMILFTAIFSTISIVEERKSGFLQAALIAPVSRSAFVLGTTLGGTSLSLFQTLLLLLLLPFIGLIPSIPGILIMVLVCFLTGLAFTALGVAIAWTMETTRGFHAIMNLFLLPLWILSGAFFPYEGASTVLQWCIKLNPVSYAVDALRIGMYMPDPSPGTLQPLAISLLISAVFAALMIGVAVWVIRKPMFKG